ncbi:hypothetical protein PMI41_03364 [Phyllobacterium sp. YR531]|nr:hypothetical protein PMI41_03364 [Phyllobacterium sp. YR531]
MPGQFDPVTKFLVRNSFKMNQDIGPTFVMVCLEINVRRAFHKKRFLLQRTMDRKTCFIFQTTDE